jgi:hypothetical protein
LFFPAFSYLFVGSDEGAAGWTLVRIFFMGLPKSKAQIAWVRYWVVCLRRFVLAVCLRRWVLLELFACAALGCLFACSVGICLICLPARRWLSVCLPRTGATLIDQ